MTSVLPPLLQLEFSYSSGTSISVYVTVNNRKALQKLEVLIIEEHFALKNIILFPCVPPNTSVCAFGVCSEDL